MVPTRVVRHEQRLRSRQGPRCLQDGVRDVGARRARLRRELLQPLAWPLQELARARHEVHAGAAYASPTASRRQHQPRHVRVHDAPLHPRPGLQRPQVLRQHAGGVQAGTGTGTGIGTGTGTGTTIFSSSSPGCAPKPP